jgi:hypothetical protein
MNLLITGKGIAWDEQLWRRLMGKATVQSNGVTAFEFTNGATTLVEAQ